MVEPKGVLSLFFFSFLSKYFLITLKPKFVYSMEQEANIA